MSNIKERLDRLRELIQTTDFLEGKGLSNEVNIRIFCYDPADEMIVQHFVRQIKADQSLNCNVIEYNMYKVFLSLCEEMDILDAIPDMVEDGGEEYLLTELQNTFPVNDYTDRLRSLSPETGDVLLITGVGDVFPFMRIHVFLNAIQEVISNIPVLAMYPGEYDGHYLKLFGRLKPNDYYRGFNVL